ncbi:thioredoxin-like (seleno)protein SaoT [Lagierella sp.]|uniref:thioredoxin-like (seleno)protein SaoT n=1 Tax=Lagierella sp. TaxID=2849657 RepID=UPI002626E605|nr:thioredoxin-like (seleno)protein SaoT [Lagierella sp.]
MGRNVQGVAKEFGDKVEVILYQQGKDVESLKKYGMVFQGTMIINETKKVTRLSLKNIKEEISKAVEELDE